MDNNYLIPANTKKSLLIFGIMRLFPDLIIAIAGVLLTIVLVLIFDSTNIWLMLIAILPALIAGTLIFPIPNYHNTLVGLQSITRFFQSRRNYIWKGWCIYDEFKDDK